MSKKEKEDEKQAAIETLRSLLPRGAKIYVIVRDVARSGMSRRMDIYAIDPGESPRWITGHVARALGLTTTAHGLRIHGYGMDMTFALADDLSRTLYRAGYGPNGLTREVL